MDDQDKQKLSNQKLTKKEERFCQEYLIDLNSAQAAIRAGYSKNSAYAIGFENLRKPKLLARLQEPLQKLTDKYEITVDRVLRECAYIAFQDPANLFDKYGNLKEIHELEEATRRAIDRIEVSDFAYSGDSELLQRKISKIKPWDKLRALEMLFKYLKLMDGDKQDMSITVKLEKITQDAIDLVEESKRRRQLKKGWRLD